MLLKMAELPRYPLQTSAMAIVELFAMVGVSSNTGQREVMTRAARWLLPPGNVKNRFQSLLTKMRKRWSISILHLLNHLSRLQSLCPQRSS
jgi:hypothetical protein